MQSTLKQFVAFVEGWLHELRGLRVKESSPGSRQQPNSPYLPHTLSALQGRSLDMIVNGTNSYFKNHNGNNNSYVRIVIRILGLGIVDLGFWI